MEHCPDEMLQERNGEVRFQTGKANSIFESAKAGAFKQVDIKGQI
jgi:SAC3 family protein LENG8/THP3